MSTQSEYQLENELISQLKQLGYASVTLKDESQLLSNLKTQIERANEHDLIIVDKISVLGFLTSKDRSHRVAEWAYAQASDHQYVMWQG